MGLAGCILTGIGSSGTFKKHLLDHGIILSCINGYETSNKKCNHCMIVKQSELIKGYNLANH